MLQAGGMEEESGGREGWDGGEAVEMAECEAEAVKIFWEPVADWRSMILKGESWLKSSSLSVSLVLKN